METKSANILIVDDEADGKKHSFELAFTADGAKLRVKHPRDVDKSDLSWADLILMDYRIEDWFERDEVECIGLRPVFGVALAGVYREYIDQMDKENSVTAIAVHTGHLGDLSARLPKDKSAHIVARLNNLEWAFRKDEDELAVRVRELADAVRALPHKWPSDPADAKRLAQSLMKLDGGTSWSERAWDDMQRSQLPLIDLVSGAHGLVFIRWLLHGILPHPTFLIDEHWLAAHLRLDLACLRGLLVGDSPLTAALGTLEYRGLLCGFQGKRWWKGAVEQFCWETRQGGIRSLHAGLEEVAGGELQSLSMRSPCVCVDKDLRPIDEIADITQVVRLVPDLWPAYAESPMALIELVREEATLAAIVHPLDEARLFLGEE